MKQLETRAPEWIAAAKEVLAGKHDSGITDSWRESLEIGLKATNHKKCQEALEYLRIRKKAKR